MCMLVIYSGVVMKMYNLYFISTEPEINVFTVATHNNHGLERFLRSAKVYGINVEVLGMGKKWVGGNMDHPGGGQKINLLKQKLKSLEKLEDRDRIILFTDRYELFILIKVNIAKFNYAILGLHCMSYEYGQTEGIYF